MLGKFRFVRYEHLTMCVFNARKATAIRITLNRVVITPTGLVPRLPPEFLLLGQSVSLI